MLWNDEGGLDGWMLCEILVVLGIFYVFCCIDGCGCGCGYGCIGY